ncbi:MAG: S8 family serine peptidase [Solirubrobacteraceae bacterium]
MRRDHIIAALVAGAVSAVVFVGGASAATLSSASAGPDLGTAPGVIHVFGGLHQPPTTAQCEAAFQVACYNPPQVQQAYGLPTLYAQGVDGKGATIVIVDSFGSPTIQTDLQTFDAAFGLPAPPSFKIYQPAGAVPPYDPTNGTMVGWAGETTLDVEYSHTVAPDANIVLLETPVAETEGVTGFPQIVQAEEWAIDHHLGDVISQSFGATEQSFTSPQQLLSQRGAYIDAFQHHITVLASSGDTGASNYEADGVSLYTYPVVGWPASDPLVTGVGGTQMHLDANGNHTSPDSAWNDTYNVPTNQFIFGDNGPNPLSSSGGLSSIFSRPFYQDPFARVVRGARGVPDVSMSAACNGAVNTYQSFGGIPAGWYGTCGTSEASPLFAGIVSLAVQLAGHPLGLINPDLYALSAFHAPGIVPVTSGNNTVSFEQDSQEYTVQGYNAQRGYSLVDGVGTIYAPAFAHELARLAR